MKKITLIFVAVFIASISFGQSSFIVQEGKTHFPNEKKALKQLKTTSAKATDLIGATIFSSDFSNPTQWTIGNSAGNSDNWIIGTSGPAGDYGIEVIASTTAANGFALFDSDFLCSQNQNANLTTAVSLNCTSYNIVRIKFETFYRKYNDDVYVQVSNNGTTWTDFDVFPNFVVNDQCENPTVIDMNISSVAANQATVWIRFNFRNTVDGCDYNWMVDDVLVYEFITPTEPDVAVTASIVSEYRMMPVTQAPSFRFAANVINNGTAITAPFNVALACVEDATYTASMPATVPFAGGANQNFVFVTAFQPTTLGSYKVFAEALPTGDLNLLDNKDTVFVIVSDSTMARDDGSRTGALGFGAGTAGWFGHGFDIANGGTDMTSVTFVLKSALIPVKVDVYNDNAGIPGSVVATTGTYTIVAADTTMGYTVLTLPLQSALPLMAGERYYLIVNEFASVNNVQLATTTNVFIEGESFVSFDGIDWEYSEDYDFDVTYLLRANINLGISTIAEIDLNDDVENGSVCVGATEADALALLVDQIVIADTYSSEYTVDVTWTIASFNGAVTGEYIATGTFGLPIGVVQTDPATPLEVYATITVNASVLPTFSFNTELCLGSGGMQFPSMSDNGILGMWDPSYVPADVAGAVDCEFIVNANQCATNAIVTVTVHALPEVTCNADFTVTNINPVTLISTPAGGIYTGTGITSDEFSANGIANGPQTIAFTYTDPTTECSNFCEFIATVDIAADAIAGIDINDDVENVSLCIGAVEADALALLADTITISDGNANEYNVAVAWSITSYNADVAAVYNATGTFTLPAAIIQTDPATILEVYATVTVNASVLPTFSFNTELCLGSGGMQFPSMSDNGILGMWDPSYVPADVAGAVDCEFIVNANQCATNTIVTVTVNALPELTCPADFTVTQQGVVALSGAAPTGGTYSGTGVTAGNFDPSSLANDEYTITYDYTDASTGCANSCEFMITVDISTSIAVNEISTIGIYPNPNNGMFTIRFANISGKANYQIYDTKGSIIVNKNIHTSGNTTEDVSLNLVSGIYFIKVVTANQTIVEKLVIQ